MSLEKHITQPFAIVLDKKGGIKKDSKETEAPSWIHLDYKDKKTVSILEKEYGLDSYASAILTSENAHQRMTILDNDQGTIIVLKRALESKAKKSASLRILFRENQIITFSHSQSIAVSKTYEKLISGNGPKDSVECLISLIQSVFLSIYEKTIKISGELDAIEETIIKNKNKKNLNIKIANTRKEIIDTHRYVIPQRDIFDNITDEIPFLKKNKYKNSFKEINSNINKAIDSLAFSREHILILQEELENSVNISINNHMYVLSIIVTIFTPLTVISGMLGMNVKGIPFAESDYAFAGVSTIMLLVCLFSFFLIRRIPKS